MEPSASPARSTAAPEPDAARRGAGAALLLLSERFLPETGGTIRWFDGLCRRYADGPVVVLTRQADESPAADGALPFRVERVALRAVPFLRPESLVSYCRLLARAGSLARRFSPAVVVAARVVPEGFVAMRLRRRFGIPFVVFVHGEEITLPVAARRRHGTRLAKLAVMRRVFAAADRVVANSAFTADLVRAFGHDGGNLVVLPPGVDGTRFAPEGEDLRRDLGLAGRRVVLTVGTLMDRKGQASVVAAMPEVLRRVPDAVYVVAGAGPAEETLRSAVRRHGVESAVRLLGRVDDARLPALYRSGDVFVLANRRLPDGDVEGFGIVYLEAAASGLPVVAGVPAGNREAFEEGTTALRVDPESPADVAAVLASLLEDPARARAMGEAGRAFVLRRFGWRALGERWNALLREVRAAAPARTNGRVARCALCGSPTVGESLRGRSLVACGSCESASIADAPVSGEPVRTERPRDHAEGEALLRANDPAAHLRARFAALAPRARFELAGLPNVRALRAGFLRPEHALGRPGTRWLFAPASLARLLRDAGFESVRVRTGGADPRAWVRRRVPIWDARDGLAPFLPASATDPASPPRGVRALLGRLADALGTGPYLSASARRP